MILNEICSKIIASDEFSPVKEADDSPLSIEGVSPSSFPMIISSVFLSRGRPLLVVTEGIGRLNELCLDLSCFIDEKYICRFPSLDTMPYEFMSSPESVERERISSIYRIMSGEKAVIVCTVDSLMRRLPVREFFIKKGLELTAGEDYPFEDIIATLVQYGYSREARVDAFGHFSVKGSIIDVFPPSMDNPVRLDFFGDTLDSIREFDILTQLSAGKETRTGLTLYPRREMVLFKKERDALRDILSAKLKGSDEVPEQMKAWFDGSMDSGENIPGIEDYFHEIIESCTIQDYMDYSHDIILVEWPELAARRDKTEAAYNELYKKKKSLEYAPEPLKLIDPSALHRAAEKAISLQTFTVTSGSLNFAMKSVPNFQGRIKNVREEINARLGEGWQIIMTTSFEGQARRLADLFSASGPDASFESYNPGANFNIVLTPLAAGAELAAAGILIITDHEIFGKSYRKRKQFKGKSSRPIDSFLDLRPGDHIVHINHGIGIFRCIERMTAGGVERDFLHIQYADDDRLYVSLDQISLVQKYIGMDGRQPRIDSLGKKSAWNRIKQKVRESVEEIAKELIKIYSQRNALKGFRYPPDTQWQEEFESLFEYEETPDQLTAIEDVKDDMETEKPMDRLICGDVGFGKTEVAIRAAFKSVMAGKQVALLVPTTVLAMQHFSTFKKRFSGYPVNIDMISRFRTKGEIIKIKDKLAAAGIDIIIGTHALLAQDINIKNLGLLIIDEEQRFGVKHKEQLKKFRALVDVLTLSATPIPRTLHISMAGIRDLTIIATPPENRQSIETYVLEDNPDILREAILNEIGRGGQVFYVYNRVQTIEAQKAILEKLVPEATFCIAHGQMHEHELEDIMIDFIEEKFDVLISTTIIESGLDMPNVNTIIINRADTFGLSQLYQLKGRVGRSVVQAYAYLFYPRHQPLTEEAQKRLRVISEYSELGSGFKIAMKDLEIRGAGNILGHEQSGNIMDVGFDLYCQMLEDEIRVLRGDENRPYFRTSLFLKTDFFIPDLYVNDDKQKIEFYKRFESCETSAEVDTLETEMIDRFGTPPVEVNVLVDLERIRAMASSLLIDHIIEENTKINIKISANCIIPREKLAKSISGDKRFLPDPKDPEILVFRPDSKTVEKKLSDLKKWLQQFIHGG